MMFCHTLYIQHNIALIIKVKAHLLLIVGNKIVTKKTKKSLCGGLHVQREQKLSNHKSKTGEKKNTVFLFASIYNLLSIEISLVRFGYIDKNTN